MLLEHGPIIPKPSIINSHPKSLDGPRLLHDLVRTSSSSHAFAIDFLEHGSKRRTLTYEELHASSDALAGSITRALAGVKYASVIVPVLLPQSPELYIALLAILKAGRAFCPISLDTPEERLNFILKDVSAHLVITNSTEANKLSSSNGLHVLRIDDELSVHNNDSRARSTPHPKPAHLAYVLYTSGSTGLPKAVSVSHRAVTQSLLAHDRHIPCFSRFLQFAAPTFDVSIFEIFFPLYRGCTLVSCTRTQMLADLPGTIASLEVDAAELTPTVVSNLLRRRSSVPGLKLLLTIGEMLTSYVVEEFGGRDRHNSILWGMYGPTEAAIHCTLQPHLTADDLVGNIGFPLDTVSAFIAAPIYEERGNSCITLLPTGDIGELVLGGPQIAEEYLNRPELTKEAFIEDPEFGYLYRTGDKARLNHNGTLECLGRIGSGQVKLRGQRIELGEIEQVILKTNMCHSTIAMIVEDTLVAFCTVNSEKASTEDILDKCRRLLPNYMVPSEIFVVQSMPQLASGKIDKSALEALLLQSRYHNEVGTDRANGEVISPIVSVIRKSLGRAAPFDLTSIDSLRSITIASALREQGYNITPVDILTTPTLKELVDTCEKRGRSATTAAKQFQITQIDLPELRAVRDDIQDILPCTPLQKAMLVETSTRPSAYCNWIEIELRHPLSFTQIRNYIEQIVNHNEILRSGFVTTSFASGSFAQVIWKILAPDAVREVATFSRSYSLGSAKSLLRPFAVQIIASSQIPRLLFQIHHALYDGWSFDLIVHELNDLMLGHTPKPRPQYREVLKYYLQLQNAKLSHARQYWSELLREVCPISLPNFNGKIVRSKRLSYVRGVTGVDARVLYARASELSMSPQVFFQAAVAYMVSLYVDSSDVIVGTVTSGRTIPVTGVEEIIGPCIASMPFRLDISEHATVKDVLKKTQKANRDMLHHCDLPLRDINKLCGLRPGERLFDVLFVWQQPIVSYDSEDLQLKIVESADDLECKVTLEFEPRDDRVLYRITYDPSSIPEQQVKYLSDQIDHVVNHFLRHIDGRIGDVASSFDSNSVSVANPRPQSTLVTHGPAYAVEKWALKTPEKAAVILGAIVGGVMQIEETLTYASINARANQLAHALLNHGVGEDQLVCIILEKSVDLYISILAVLKVDCGYLPIAPDTPRERTNQILKDAEIALCISHSSISTNLPRVSITVLELDRLDLSHCSDQNLDIPYDGSHLAYAVFTSGSTGKPKGVLVTQDNLMSNLDYLSSLYPVTCESRMLQSCSQAFDVSVFEIFFSWYVGICICTATTDDLFYNFGAAINSLDITHLSLTPTVAGLVDPSRVPKVKFLVTAGEALTEKVRRKWAGKGLFQGYGPSETTNICTVRPYVTSDDLINNIGKPFSNTSALVLAPGKDYLVPRGAVGELCFGGSQVFRGYLKMPELNAEKIIDHSEFGRIYRSGDMGMLLPDDSILSTGRIDDQVKIRGQRVELGEITALLLDHPEVLDCTTLLGQHHCAQGLICFWVPTEASATTFSTLPPLESRSTIAALFETLSLQLPSYMVPSHLIPISRIPMTPQAKVDKRLLQSTFQNLSSDLLELSTSSQDADTGVEDFSALEQTIVEALARALNVATENVRRTTSFYNLGVDSISAIRFAQGLRNTGFDRVSVSTILKNPSVKRLSMVLANESTQREPPMKQNLSIRDVFSADWTARIKSEFRDRGEVVQKILPCTPLQEAMLSSTSPHESSSYQNTMVFKVQGQLEHLKQSWNRMFVRHEILRTAFVATDVAQYAFAQIVLAPSEVQWEQIGSSDNPAIWFIDLLPDLLKQHLPPVRMAIQKNGHLSKIVFSCHHALYDGSAISALLDDVQEAYLDSPLPPPVPYEPYLQQMINQDLVAADNFWITSLTEFEPSHFPKISSRLHKLDSRNHSVEMTLQTSFSQGRSFCQSSSTSLVSLVQASWAKVLHFCIGESDICFGNVVSGRTLPEEGLERLVAPCFNTLPVRLKFDFRSSNAELCKQLHTINIDCLPFQLTPLRRIQSNTLKDQGRLFDSLVILQQPSTALDQSIWTLEQDLGEMDLPVVCEVFQDRENILRLMLHYNTSLMSESDAMVLAKIFDNALHALIQYPSSSANDTVGFPTQLLGQSNMNWRSLEPSQGGLLHSALELNAVKHPNTLALDFQHANGDRATMSFKQLNKKANQVAHALLQRGVKTEDIVPVHMLKSPQFYVSIVGILKAGAAFAPIHPDLPEGRKRFMLSELRSEIMLCLGDELDWSGNTAILNVDNVADFPSKNPIVRDLRSTNLAYCLYTSGSTGLPKAVSMEHQAPIQTIESSRISVPWKPSSRLLQYAATTFDMCYYDCFLAWTFGFTLCAADQDVMLNNLTEIINTLHIDLLDLTPSVAASLRHAEVPGVKWLYCIGEAMPVDVVREWDGICVNSYGPTEAAFCTTIFPTDTSVNTSVIGKPFPTTSFAVFPPNGDRPLPILAAGELYIGGAQLARGYFNNLELSEDKFVQKCGQSFYKSGDIVRMLSDGNFDFLGRADDQVKIRGLRVELGEISHVLQDCDKRISAVATQILNNKTDTKNQLVAFLVTGAQVRGEERSELMRQAKQATTDHLPAYMVPQFFIFVDKIPKSMAGKIDKKALLQLFRDSNEVRSGTHDGGPEASTHDWTKNEHRLRDIFSKLSKTSIEDITPWTTIYQLGLDSISAVQIAANLRKQSVQANAAEVMKYMNCKDLAAYLDKNSESTHVKTELFDFEAFERKHREEVVSGYRLNNDDIEAVCPCTPLQSGILSQFVAKDGDIYFNYLRLRMNTDVDLRRMKDVWSTVMSKHRMLRTGFAYIMENKIPFAMIQYREQAVELPWDDKNTQTTPASVEVWLERSRQNAAKELHRPPWRIKVVEENEEVYLDLALLHAIFDAQSLRLIFNDVSTAYNDGTLGESRHWEKTLSSILNSSRLNDLSSNFWKQLGKTVAPTRFPNLTPLRYTPSPPELVTKSSTKTLAMLKTGCRTANTSLQVAALASWATLLASYTGERSATFGVILSGRNFDGAEDAVFPCITTVPFVCKISDRKEDTLQEATQMNTNLHQHQFTPLNEIQKLMGYPNEQMFDSIFAFQKHPTIGNGRDPWTIVKEKAATEYPISIELEPKDDRLEYRLTFLPHLVPKEQTTVILEQLDHLLQCYIFSDTAEHGAFDPRIFSITSAKESTLPSEARLLHEMVEITAAQYPNRVALEFATSIKSGSYESQKWTYAHLEAEGNRIAQLLISHSVCPGELVGVCFDKCAEASFAMLGILKAGCAFVALDPGAPTARKAFIVKDSGAKVVLSMNIQSADMMESVQATIINLDEVGKSTLSSRKPVLPRDIDPQDRSYCLYTSGTTGTPKGCELTHENAVQAMLSFQRLFNDHWSDDSRWLQFASFHFDVSVLEQYWSWSVGICVVSAPRDLIFEDLAASIRTLGITHIDLTPSLARILHPDDVPSLCRGVFITGGESLKQEILDVWGPKGIIYNGYGPTEATIGVTMYPRVPSNGKPLNIGPQFDNVGSYVLRPGSDVPVLRGGIGELCVSGKLVGKGYLNRPDLTEAAFPLLSRFDERVYRTGDLVRILHDGTFEFLGRADDQVKLRGQRLEIGEINAVIKQSRVTVADVATLVIKHPRQPKEQLVAFIVLGSSARGQSKILLKATQELRAAKQTCQDKLPPYMVPTHYVALTVMPLNVNNKADARKLKEMYGELSPSDLQTLSSVSQAKDEKWSKNEERIRNVLKDVLDIEEDVFRKDASFFELGMDSISVIGVSRALKQATFTNAAASVVMGNATIRRLAKALADKSSISADRGSSVAAQQAIIAVQHKHRRSVAETLFMDARNIEALAPCTPLQQGMIARSFESESGLYFNTFCFDLTKETDLDRLQEAWEMVFNSTQILRTAFVNTDDGYVQAVLRKATLRFDRVTLDNDDKPRDVLEGKRMDWIHRNQTIIKTPLELVLVEGTEHKRLIVHIFHALYDGISIELVFGTAWDAYNKRNLRCGPPFQSALAYGPLRSMEGAREFWEKHLAKKIFNPFPDIIDIVTEAPVSVTGVISNLSNLEATRRRLNTTAQAIAQACWTNILHQYIKGTVTLGLVVSGRSMDFEDAEKVNGPLFNTIPYQYRPQQRETWASLIKRSHDFNVASHSFQHTPLRDIMKWCKQGPAQPLFDTLFVYQVADGNATWMKNEAWELVDGGAEADYPLAIEVEQRGSEELKITLVAEGHVLDEENARHLLQQFEEALRQALREPNDRVMTHFDGGEEGIGPGKSQKNKISSLRHSGDRANPFQWTTIAAILREEIANLADTDNISAIDDKTSIFELGLDSIDAIKLSSKLKKRGINLAVSGMMRSLNIANMLQYISTDEKKRNERPSDMIYQTHKRRLEIYLQRRGLTDGVEKILPLTPLQEAMVAEMVASDYARYYNHDVLKLAPDTDLEKLWKAWTDVVSLSPILRSSFVHIDDPSIDSSFAQVIHQKPHAFMKATKAKEKLGFPAIFEGMRQKAVKQSTLGPLFHVQLVQSPKQTHVVLSIAHALYDGWSLGLLHQDVHQAYNGNLKPRPSYEPALSEILTTSGSDAVAFWRDYLSDATPSLFPRLQESEIHNPQTVHDEEQASNLALGDVTAFAKKSNISLQTLGQTVFALAIASYTHTMDVTFGSVLSGRDDDEKSKLLFPTMNTVAIRTILHGTRREMLQYVQENFSNIKQWQHFPLRKALSLAGVQGALFDSLFIYQKSMGSHEKGKKLYESIEGRSDVEYPVCVEMEVVGEELIWRCAVKEESFDNIGAQELLNRLDEVMRNIIDSPNAASVEFTAEGTSICGLPAFEDEHAQIDIMDKTNDEDPDFPQFKSITAKTIREVLAFVSKTPEEEITEGMTIFHIGLDSISAIKVCSLLRKRGIILNVGEMLKAGTVEQMASIVDERPPTTSPDEADAASVLEEALTGIDRAAIMKWAGVDKKNIEMMLPATAGQTYMLSMWLNSEGTMFYPEFKYEVHGSITFDSLQAAWKALIAGNPVLRTCFYAVEDNRMSYVQTVLSQVGVWIQDITGWDEEDVAKALYGRDAQQPYLYLLASRSTEGWDLRLKIHHALYDGVSLPLILQQLQDLCNGKGASSQSDAFVKFIAASSNPSALDSRKSFWINYLKGIQQHDHLPQPRSAPTSKIELLKRGLISDTRHMEFLARKNGTSAQSLFLAVYAKLYARLTSTPTGSDIVIGIYLANRSHPIPDLAQAPIPTVNLIPIRVLAPLQTEMLEMAAQIQYDIQEISSTSNAGVALWEIDEWTGVRVDCWVNFLKLPDAEDEERGEGKESITIAQREKWDEEVSRVARLDIPGFGKPREVICERINEAYLHSLDIEATIWNNALDVGIFAPEEVLGLQGSEKLIGDIKDEIESVIREFEG